MSTSLQEWKITGVRPKPPGCSPCRYSSVGVSFVPDDYGENALLAVVLEGPGSEEAIDQRPLTGKTGRFFFKTLIEPLGYKREDLLICNTIRCHPPKNEYPAGELRKHAESCCRVYDSVHAANKSAASTWEAKAVATQGFIPGGIVKFDPDLFVVTYHPSAIFRTRALLRLVQRDLTRAFGFVKDGYRPCVLMGEKATHMVAPQLHGGIKKWRGHYWEGSWPINRKSCFITISTDCFVGDVTGNSRVQLI